MTTRKETYLACSHPFNNRQMCQHTIVEYLEDDYGCGGWYCTRCHAYRGTDGEEPAKD